MLLSAAKLVQEVVQEKTAHQLIKTSSKNGKLSSLVLLIKILKPQANLRTFKANLSLQTNTTL